MSTAAQTLISAGAGVSTALESSEAYHEAELRSMAAFRLREAADRLAALLAMSRSTRLRTELRVLRIRLLSEENDLLSAVRGARPSRRARDARVGGRTFARAGF